MPTIESQRFSQTIGRLPGLSARALLCAAAWLSVAVTVAAQPSYRVIEVAPAGARESDASDIDPTGTYVTGWAAPATSPTSIGPLRAFRWSGGASSYLGPESSFPSQGFGVNAAGQVVGIGIHDGLRAPYRWSDNNATPLQSLRPVPSSSAAETFARSINAAGQAVGVSRLSVAGAELTHQAVLWPAGSSSVTTLQAGQAYAINDAGDVVGWTGIGRCSPKHEFSCSRATRWANGVVTRLEPPPGPVPLDDTYAFDINEAGQVVGEARQVTIGPSFNAAVLWSGGAITVLGRPDGRGQMIPSGINEAGQVVGRRALNSGAADRAFLWQGGVEYDLTSLLDAAGAGRVIRSASAISDDGKIAARACGSSLSNCAAVVLVPVPPAEPVPAYTRYLAEGATSAFFDTQIALLNPGPANASATLQYLPAGGAPIMQAVTVPARTRLTINPKMVPGLAAAEFSTVVQASQELVVDRTMSWDGVGYGSHSETAVRAPATTWYLAEGATIGGFDLFYLLQNPAETPTTVRVRYLRAAGAPLSKAYLLPARSRTNIWVNREDFPGLGLALSSAEVSAVIESQDNTPIIVERAMYRSNQGRTFNAGHESTGVSAPATDWFLAEGATGNYFDMFVLIANPSPTDAQVTVTYLTESGTTYSRNLVAPANARSGIWVDQEQFADVAGKPLADAAVSTTVKSTNGVALVVERAMWWPGDSSTWHEAHNSAGATSTGTKWAVAEGEVGGARRQETYLLIANTSPYAGSATVTLLFEDGTSLAKVLPLAPSSRTNVAVGPEFGTTVTGKRFGAVIESTGTTPALIVVERAMYSNANGVTWAAGTNALATKLQ